MPDSAEFPQEWVETLARTVCRHARGTEDVFDDPGAYTDDHRTRYRDVAVAVLNVLDGLGALLPPGGTTCHQWGVRVLTAVESGVGLPYNQREDAVRALARRAGQPGERHLVQRVLRTWPNGRVLAGPWQEATDV
jgi:hypothetical protein